MTEHTLAMSRIWSWVVPAREADWDALYELELPRIYNFFRYRVGDGPEAEDLTSITFEKAWRARDRYRRDLASFRTWLFAIARNVAIDHFRKRRDHAPLEEAEGLPGGETPEDTVIRRSEVAHLSHLLGLLPERERELLALKYGAGLTNRAIARMTGLSESNVGTIVHRTVALLRAGWNEGA
jgi:RNA polymerase sigma-70 factor (ECF subfamily)